MKKAIKHQLKLRNPTYEQAIRTNPRARYVLSEYIKYYRETQHGCLILGRGNEGAIRTYADRINHEIKTIDCRHEQPCTTPITTSITLRDYQRGVVSAALHKDSGMLRLDTGFGKTIIGIELIGRLRQRTLIIVPKLDLLNQWIHEIKQWTDIKTVGVIQGKNVDIQDITVATVQSLGKQIDRGTLSRTSFGCVLVDECHGFTTPKRRVLLESIPSRHCYGLTATARRSDGQGEALRWIFGDVLVDRKLPRATPTIRLAKYHGHIMMQEYADMITEQVEDTDRNLFITNIVQTEINKGRKILVLTKRVNHYEQIAEGLDADGIIPFGSGQKKKERDELLRSLRKGTREYSCILGTFNLLSTGIDIPSLDTLIIAGDLKSDVLSEQSVGRVLRLFEGKDDPVVIDVQDQGNPILRRQASIREQFYKDQGWIIETYENNIP